MAKEILYTTSCGRRAREGEKGGALGEAEVVQGSDGRFKVKG